MNNYINVSYINKQYNILYYVNSGGFGIVYALSNNNKFPILILKLFYEKFYNRVLINKLIDSNCYKQLCKYNIIIPILDIVNYPSQIYGSTTYLKNYKQNISLSKYDILFNNHLYFYEIGGICQIYELFNLFRLNKYKNYNLIINCIKIIVNKCDLMVSKANVIHRDLHLKNIMFKNKYTLYLFDIYNKYNKNKDLHNLKILKNYIFKNKNIDKTKEDKNLIKKYNITTYTPIDNDIDVFFIDIDYILDINDIIKCFDKYNKNNKDVQEIIKLILSIVIHSDKIKVLYTIIINDIFTHLSVLKDNTQYNNLKYIYDYTIKLYKNVIDEIIEQSSILNNLHNITLSNNIIWYIIVYISNSSNIDIQKMIDTVFNYLYIKQYTKDDFEYSIIGNPVNIFNRCIYNGFEQKPYTKEEIKKIFI